MAPKKNVKSQRRGLLVQPHEKAAPVRRGGSVVLPRPLARTITTLHHGHGISIAAPGSPRYVNLSTVSSPQPDYSTSHHTPVQRLESSAVSIARQQTRVAPVERRSSPALGLPNIGSQCTPEDAEDLLETMTEYFRQWTEPGAALGLPDFFEDMSTIADRMQSISSLPNGILASPSVLRSLHELEKEYTTFASIWAPYIQSAFAEKLVELQAQIRQSATSVREGTFTSLISDIQSMLPHPALRSVLDLAEEDAPVLLDPDVARDLMTRCEELHNAFQNSTYNKSERRMLWLLIWKCLKAAFMNYEVGGLTHLTDQRCLEADFFCKPGVSRELRRLIQLPDAANPRTIENMVGKYCRFIDRCRANPHERYFHLRQLREKSLRHHVLSSLKRFAETRLPDTNIWPKVHFAVIRLNSINGGPAVVRRWREEEKQGEWVNSPSYLPSPPMRQSSVNARRTSGAATTSVPHGGPRSAPDTESSIIVNVRSTPTTTELHIAAQVGERAFKRSFPHPQGLNYRSDFDYVHCPFPETRAQEVAQSEQISRELASPEIYSEGPRIEYLVNRPPAHTQDPAELSVFTTTRMPGPFGWVRSVIRKVLRSKGRTASPIVLVPRRGRGDHSSGRRRGVIDPNSRIQKTPPAPRLRGGGGDESSNKQPAAKKSSIRLRFAAPKPFQAQHIALFRRQFHARHGSIASPDGPNILRLLERATYHVDDALDLYEELALTNDSADTELAQDDEPNAVERNPTRTRWQGPPRQSTPPAGSAPLRRPLGELPAGGEVYDDNEGQRYGLRPRPHRQPLRELPAEEEGFDSVQGSPDNVRGQSRQGPSNGTEREGSSHPSNQENQPPVEIHRDGQCHECPQFPGQYHHFCHCQVQVVHVHRSPHSTNEDEVSDDPTEYQDENQDPNQPEDSIEIYDEDQDADGSGDSPQTYDETPDPDDSEDPSGDDDDNTSVDSNPEGQYRPVRTLPHRDDGMWVQDWQISHDEGFGLVFKTIWEADLTNVFGHLDGYLPELATSPQRRAELRDDLEDLRRRTNELRAAYRTLAGRHEPVQLDKVPKHEKLRRNPDFPATPELIMRGFTEVREQYKRMNRMLARKGRPYSNLALRQALNRFLRLVRDLRRLFIEYDHRISHPSSDEEDSSDTDSQPFLSDDEQRRVNSYQPPQRPGLPTRKEYDMMFKDELLRELAVGRDYQNRSIKIDNMTKKQLVSELMRADREGNLGAGARHGYRNMMEDPRARGRPKNFNLDDAIEEYKRRCEQARDAEKDEAHRQRQAGRRAQGLSNTRGWEALPAGQAPFTLDIDDLGVSADALYVDSEDESTDTAPSQQ
ncbi:hypothetical protein LTR93_001933 [Exophiala xenobiotica]|nr:hypothetical protein LTR93_001933 [Exophiala xenobiotica]KAK5417286.1 hypothetical protein LTR06_003273 [Exophiala xenobiotica]